VTDPWLFEGAPGALDSDVVALIEGTTFCLSDRAGDVTGGQPAGLFVRDTRMVSRWQLRLAGRPGSPMTVSRGLPFTGTVVSSLPAGPGTSPGVVVVVRHRSVGNGMLEELLVVNTTPRQVSIPMTLQVGSDFADLFEVKDGRAHRAPLPVVPDASSVVIQAPGNADGHAVRVIGDERARASAEGLHWDVVLDAHGEWRARVEVRVAVQGEELPLHHRGGAADETSVPVLRHEHWHRTVPRLRTPDRATTETLRQSLDDLSSLRIFDPDRPELPVVAAGAPWFMALFGRDSVLTSMMTLMIDSRLALGTLSTLAAHQGSAVDVLSEEEPGRILHEIRFGPSGTLALGGRPAYYGSVDATPLFVMLLGEVVRWRGLDAVTRGLVPHADRALEWMTTYGDPDGDGFIEYARKHDRGLVNQGWKDSWDGINFADGRLAEPPLALAEVQGYAYAAYQARSQLATELGDTNGAHDWAQRAADLKSRFDAAFWITELGRYAVALDRDKRQVDALASNIGHCLWTGIVDPRRAGVVAQQLMSSELFSGWGIRTLGSGMGAYDPLSYHNGSVWPHDTALCAAGLARYGFREEAGLLAGALFDAAEHFGHRLPELFGGFAREQVPVPVPYPAACSPQAWAAAAPVELVRTLLGLDVGSDDLHADAAVPARFRPLRVDNLEVRGRRYSVEVDRGGRSGVRAMDTS